MASLNYIPMVRTRAILPFVEFLREGGAPVNRWLQAAKVPCKLFHSPDSLIPLHAGTAFLGIAVRQEGLATLGLRIGACNPLEHLGPFGQLLLASMTLFEAMETTRQMIPAHNSGLRIWIEKAEHHARIVHHNLTPPGIGRQQVDLYGLMAIRDLVRRAAGPNWQPLEVGLQMSFNREIIDAGVFADARFLFDQPASFLKLPAELLILELRPPAETSPLYRHELTDNLQKSAPAMDLVSSLRQAIAGQMRDGRVGLKSVAESVGTSSRSLQRRLFETGIQYSRLVEQVRFEHYKRLMGDPTLKLRDLAGELGYRDCSNFSRAFKRWTGVTPSDFRNQSGQD